MRGLVLYEVHWFERKCVMEGEGVCLPLLFFSLLGKLEEVKGLRGKLGTVKSELKGERE